MADLQDILSSGDITGTQFDTTAAGDKVLKSDEVEALITAAVPVAISTLVPYTGATTNVDLGTNTIRADRIEAYNVGKTGIVVVNVLGLLKPIAGTTGMVIRSGEFAGSLTTPATSGTIATEEFVKGTPTVVSTATYTVLGTDTKLHVTNTATAATTITIPTALITAGIDILIKDGGGLSGTNNITIIGEGGETIDGAATAVIAGNYDAISIYSDGTNLFIY